eukprot:TRINITY_DN10978_c0_g2_i1.p1 TRINITY_DN10978_c0_g2~~TRINITY_DN10978_c0_g2_i1.p1  ORF type:complete len:127 (+),score=23.27 TRINITY_DN10978_c0_g2_i1:371-751(+)
MIMSAKCDGPLTNVAEIWKKKRIEKVLEILPAVYTKRSDTNFDYNEEAEHNDTLQDLNVNNKEAVEDKKTIEEKIDAQSSENLLEEELSLLTERRVRSIDSVGQTKEDVRCTKYRVEELLEWNWLG